MRKVQPSQNLAKDLVSKANNPIQGFMARKNTQLEKGHSCNEPRTGCAFSSKHPRNVEHPKKTPIGCVTRKKLSGVCNKPKTSLPR